MIVEHTRDPRWLSNGYLVADRPGGHCVLIDTGGPARPLLERVEELRLTPTHVLCTHHHHDHVAHNDDWRVAHGCPVCGHASEESLFSSGLERTLTDGEEIRSGGLAIRALHVPGHTLGQLAFLVDERALFTGDTLFRDTVGGTRGPGHTTFEDLQQSILEVLLAFPDDTRVLPGHMEETTVGRERARNPFVRLWRGEDAPANTLCTALGRPATLLLRARDYDGGTKCQVRFEEDGRLDVVPGSRVEDRA